jgi:hypothetical protein
MLEETVIRVIDVLKAPLEVEREDGGCLVDALAHVLAGIEIDRDLHAAS